MRKKRLWQTAMAVLLCSITMSAHDFEVDDIYYNITSMNSTVEVTYRGDSYDSYREYNESVTIPKTVTYNSTTYRVTSIGDDAFRGCNLTSITIPEGVTSIGNYAFSFEQSFGGGDYVSRPAINVYCLAEQVPAIGALGNSGYDYLGLYVPRTAIDAYKSADGWKDFDDILPLGMEGITSITQLDNTQVYWVGVPRGASWAVAEGGKVIASNVDLEIKMDYEDPRQQFAFISNDGGVTRYLYHVAEKKFVAKSGQLSEYPFSPVYFMEGAYENTFFAYFDSLHYVNVAEPPTMRIDDWSTPDEGNSCSIIPMGTFDPTEVLANWPVVPENEVLYSALGDGKAKVLKVSSSLTAMEIPATVTIDGEVCEVTSIGSYAFEGCSSLTAIIIPENVTGFGEDAFVGCSSLKQVIIEDGSTALSAYGRYYNYTGNYTGVFNDCPLEKVYLGRNLSYGSSYGSSPFSGQDALTSVTIGGCVTEIGNSAFSGCSSLTSVTIPKNVTEIGDNAFAGCTALKELIFEDGSETLSLGNIDDYRVRKNIDDDGYEMTLNTAGLFFDCPLERMYLGRNLSYGTASYEGSPFFYQTAMKSVTIGNRVTEIGDYAFYNCKSLSSINFSKSIEKIGVDAFYGTSWSLPDGLHYIGKVLYGYVGTMPKNTSIKVKEGTVTIYRNAFFGCSGLASIAIPESVTEIGDNAFSDCSSLTSIAIPESSIGDDAFSGCTGLEYVKLNCPKVNNWFSDNTALKEVVLGEGVTAIGYGAFYNCSGLTSINIPKSVTEIGTSAFYGCTGLKRVKLNCPEVSDWFKGCTALEDVVLGDGVTLIGDGAFFGCSGFASIAIPKGVTEIRSDAFYGCSSLASISVSGSVTEIGDGVFDNCTSLKEIIFEDGGDTLNLGCNKKGSVRRPGEGMFYDCPLEKVYVGRNLSYEASKSYGYSPFYEKAALDSLTIGVDVTEIGGYAFSGCSNLASITSCAVNPPACASTSFEGVDTTIPVTVPEGSVADYQIAEVWKDFTNFVGADLSGIDIVDNSQFTIHNSQFIYDLRGRRVTHPEKGIYIVNGKKVVVK